MAKLDMVMPIVDENCQEIELLKARHPLIDQKEVVANDIVLKKPQDILLISGSNTGGKTVALKQRDYFFNGYLWTSNSSHSSKTSII